MKALTKMTVAVTLLVLLLQACTPDKITSVGDPFDRVAQMQGTWKLKRASQIDLFAQRSNYKYTERTYINLIENNITDAAPYTDIVLTLNGDAAKKPTNFTINFGNAPQIFPISSGNWKVNEPKGPSMLLLYPPAGGDTTKINFGNLADLSSGILNLQVTRYRGNKSAIQYNYVFNRN